MWNSPAQETEAPEPDSTRVFDPALARTAAGDYSRLL
jgi:hypothetical protein